jgi:hypothetical protein
MPTQEPPFAKGRLSQKRPLPLVRGRQLMAIEIDPRLASAVASTKGMSGLAK